MSEPDPVAGAHTHIQRLLARMRTYLNLDVAFVSELFDELRVIHYVDAAALDEPVRAGTWSRREDSYCHYVVTGELPQLLREAARHPLARSLAVTEQLGVGSHVSVPIVLSDGTVYGTLCAFAHHVEETLNEAQLDTVRVMAETMADILDEVHATRRVFEGRRKRLRTAVGHAGPTMLLQPVVRLATGELAGVEALARFPTLEEGPAEVFDEAWEVGVGLDLEMAAVDAAIDLLGIIPDGAFLAVNVAPSTFVAAAFAARAATLPPGRLVAELTERSVLDVEQLAGAAEPLGECGVRFAVDDVGTGFSGLERILRVGPDILKIDKSLVRDVDGCPARHALIAALVSFARCMGTTTVAEGIETADELTALRALGVDWGQGYHLARPCEPEWFGVGRLVNA